MDRLLRVYRDRTGSAFPYPRNQRLGVPQVMAAIMRRLDSLGELVAEDRAAKAAVSKARASYNRAVEVGKKLASRLRGKGVNTPAERELVGTVAAARRTRKAALDELERGAEEASRSVKRDFFAIRGDVKDILETDCYYAGPYKLWAVKGGVKTPRKAPGRKALLGAFPGEARGEHYTAEMRLETEGAWGPWKLALGGETITPTDWRRFYALWKGIQGAESASSGAGADRVEFRYCALIEDGVPFEVFAGEKNCAIALLSARFPTRAAALGKIGLTEGGGFSEEQAYEAARVLKRNIVVKCLQGGVVMVTTKEDGSPLYRGTRRGAEIAPVIVYISDGHAVEDLPVMPKDFSGGIHLVDHDCRDALRLKREFGPACRIWPIRDGAVVERWMDSPVLVRTRTTYEAVMGRAEELGVEGCELTGSAFGVECKAWRQANGFGPTTFCRELWSAGITYETPYCTMAAEGNSVDLNSAYASSPLAGAKDYYARYGMPSSGGMFSYRNVPAKYFDRALACTGLAVVKLDLDGCHPWVRHVARKSPRGIYTTMRLQMWAEHGAVKIDAIELLVVAVKTFPSLEAPDGELSGPPGSNKDGDNRKHWVREAIGRLAPGAGSVASMDEYFTSDAAEASAIVHKLKAEGRLGTYKYVYPAEAKQERESKHQTDEEFRAELDDLLRELSEEKAPENDGPGEEAVGGFHVIGALPKGLPATACYHVRAYYIDYTGIVVDREIFSHEWADIVKVKLDSITLAPGAEFSAGVTIGTEPGQWKTETYVPAKYPSYVAKALPEAEIKVAIETSASYWAPAASSSPATVIEAPPGYGKTHGCMELVGSAGLKGACTVLVPTKKMRKKFRAEHPGVRVVTWQWALLPRKEFSPMITADRLNRGQILYIPEIGTWDKAWASSVVPWLTVEHGCRVLADGDRRQMPPYDGIKPWSYLDSDCDVVDLAGFEESRDWRSKTPELADLKMTLREAVTNHDAIGILVSRIGGTEYCRFLEEWHPRDYIYITTHDMRRSVDKDLEGVHKKKWPEQQRRIRFDESAGENSGGEAFIGLLDDIPEGASLAYSMTYSCCQGETAGPDPDFGGRRPRVWLMYHKVHQRYENCVYVGATRVETEDQLGVIIPPDQF